MKFNPICKALWNADLAYFPSVIFCHSLLGLYLQQYGARGPWLAMHLFSCFCVLACASSSTWNMVCLVKPHLLNVSSNASSSWSSVYTPVRPMCSFSCMVLCLYIRFCRSIHPPWSNYLIICNLIIQWSLSSLESKLLKDRIYLSLSF